MIQKNVASQGVYLMAYDTTLTPTSGKAGDSANITGAWSKDGGAETSGFTTANPTNIGGGVYWQPLSQAETNGNRLSFRWVSATTGVVIDPMFVETTGVNFPANTTVAVSVWDEVNTAVTHNVTNSTGKQLRTLAVNTGVIYSGTAPSQAGMTSVQIKLDGGASAVDNIYQWDVISLTGGAGAGDSAIITAYNGTTKVATVNTVWAVQPDATTVFSISPTAQVQVVSYIAGQDPATLVLNAVAASYNTAGTIGAKINLIAAAPTAAAIATAVWTDTTAGDFTTATSPGKIIFTQLGGTFTTTSSSVFSPAALANGPTGSGGLDAAGVRAAIGMASANLDTQLAAIKSDTGSTVSTLSTVTTTLSTIAGYVDTEISSIISTLSTIGGNVTTILTNTTGTADVNVVSFTAPALAQFFTVDTGERYAAPYSDAVAGSVVGEIVGNVGLDIETVVLAVDSQLSDTHGSGAWGGGGGLTQADVRAAIGMASANLDTQLAAIKSDTGSTFSTVTSIAGDVTTILDQTDSPLTAAQLRAALGMASADLDAQLDFILASLGDFAGLDAAGIRAAIGLSTNNLDTQLGDLPTAAENADKLLGRNLEGGSDSGRNVREALYFLRNKWWIEGGFVHVCNTSDVESWSGVVSQSNATPVTGIDPA